MPVDIYDKEFQNWLKGVLALNTTRDVLCGCVTEKLEKFVSSLPDEERAHLHQFLECLNINGIQQLKQRKPLKKSNIKYGCEHKLCKQLLERFLAEHEEKAKLQYNWECNTKRFTKSNPTTGNKDRKEVVWRLTMLYMFVDVEETADKYQCIDDLDISNIIKTMRSCTLFVTDCLEFFDEVIGFRNYLMHSPNNKVTEEYLKQKLEKAIKLLETLTKSNGEATCMTKEQHDAIQDLQKLGEDNFAITYQSEEHKYILAQVVEAEKIADDLYKSFDENAKESKAQSKRLQTILDNISKKRHEDNIQQKQSLICKASEFKSLVKDCIERKKKSIELDKTQCGQRNEQDENSKMLEKLQKQVEEDLTDINVQLKKTDDEEVADLLENLNTEVVNLKKEKKKKEIELLEERERNRKEVEILKSKQQNPEVMKGVPNGSDDKQPAQRKYLESEDKDEIPDLNDCLRFYMNEIPLKPEGYFVDKIHVDWWGEYSLLETHRGYVQWLFPVRESGLNSHAEEQQLLEIQTITSNRIAMKRVLTSYKMMLDSYGMVLDNEDDGTIRRADNWKERFPYLNKSSHNYSRIKRILKCLGEFGYEHLKKNFVKFILCEGLEEGTLSNLVESCVKYWIQVLHVDEDRDEMLDYYEKLTKDKSLLAKKKKIN